MLDERALEASAIVANNRMNRERVLTGANGDDRELGFDVIDFVRQRREPGKPVRWLDVCCGTGRALLQAAAGFGESPRHSATAGPHGTVGVIGSAARGA